MREIRTTGGGASRIVDKINPKIVCVETSDKI